MHEPDTFTLPNDHNVSAQPMLTPCEDIEFLMAKFQRDVCAIVGILEETILTKTKARMANTVHCTLAAGKIFSSNMKQLCNHLQQIAADAYQKIYLKHNAIFSFIPMPCLKIEKIADLKVFFNICVITSDVSIQLTELLMGDEITARRKRMQLEEEEEQVASKKAAILKKDQSESTSLNASAQDKAAGWYYSWQRCQRQTGS